MLGTVCVRDRQRGQDTQPTALRAGCGERPRSCGGTCLQAKPRAERRQVAGRIQGGAAAADAQRTRNLGV